jgi:hypothetical protein
MLRAALLVGATWTTLSFLFCLAWGRALAELPARKCARRKAGDPGTVPYTVSEAAFTRG